MQNIEISNRLKEFRLQLNHNQQEFADIFGIQQSTYSRLESPAGTIDVNHIRLLIEKLDINPDWLLTGNGTMFNVSKDVFQANDLVPKKIKDRDSNTLIQLPISGRASAGYQVGYGQENERQYLEVRGLPSYMEEIHRAFTIDGNSMSPYLQKDDIVFCVRVIDITNYLFKKDNVYIIVCNEGIVVKHLQKTNQGLLAVPHNPTFNSYLIAFEDIYEIWHAVKRISSL